MAKRRVDFPNGDYFVGAITKEKPSGEGTYFVTEYGISFTAVWDKEYGPLLETVRVDNPTERDFVFLFEESRAVYRIAYLKAIFPAKVGEIAYDDMHMIHLLCPFRRNFKILECGEGAITYEVAGIFNKDSQPMTDMIRKGERKAYEDHFENGTVFADDYVEFEEHYHLELLLI